MYRRSVDKGRDYQNEKHFLYNIIWWFVENVAMEMLCVEDITRDVIVKHRKTGILSS